MTVTGDRRGYREQGREGGSSIFLFFTLPVSVKLKLASGHPGAVATVASLGHSAVGHRTLSLFVIAVHLCLQLFCFSSLTRIFLKCKDPALYLNLCFLLFACLWWERNCRQWRLNFAPHFWHALFSDGSRHYTTMFGGLRCWLKGPAPLQGQTSPLSCNTYPLIRLFVSCIKPSSDKGLTLWGFRIQRGLGQPCLHSECNLVRSGPHWCDCSTESEWGRQSAW